jgi:putative DNA primase/helicase
MIAAFALAPEIEPGILAEPREISAIHLTKLAPNGRGKAGTENDKMSVGRPAARPIMLAPVNDSLGLAITEGIEDALSVAWALGMGAWAAGSAGFMPALADAVPGYVERVTIYAHDDPAGRRGALELADQLVARGIEVFVEGV